MRQVLLVVIGGGCCAWPAIVFTLQGLGYVGGGFMSGLDRMGGDRPVRGARRRWR